jgi:hypothetical protein
MKRLFLMCLLLMRITQYSQAQTYFHLTCDAWRDYQKKDYENALKTYENALKISKNDPSDIYNAACSAALCGQTGKALSLLKESVACGFNDLKNIKEDPDLVTLRALADWDKIYSELIAVHERVEKKYNRPLRDSLLNILRDDQDIRGEYLDYIKTNKFDSPGTDSLRKIILNIDSVNQEKMVKIIDQYGWVGNKEVGVDAARAVFAVIQHANIDIQKKYFPLLEKAVKEYNASASYMALMQDRILVREGKKQIFGTQIGTVDTTGKNYLFPLEDPAGVDQRRADVGLGPLKDYLKHYGLSQEGL